MSLSRSAVRPLLQPASCSGSIRSLWVPPSQAQHARLQFPARRLATSTDAADKSKLPLKGIRVLDMTRVLAGPFATQMMGDLGAEVIKIEHPKRGDDTRAWGPPYAKYTPESGKQGPGESAYYLSANRNKKSLGLSFQDPAGVKILHELAKTCDVLVENYLPGSLAKYKMDYKTLSEINPKLVYASVTGYGQTGPYSTRAGYDVMVEAEFGLMHITGTPDGPPVKVGVAITDLTTGLYTSMSVLAALLARASTGRGQHIDVALSDCQTASLANIASSVLVTGGRDSGRHGDSHPSIVPYRSFVASDGGSVLLGGGNDKLFGILATKLDRADWIKDPKFATNSARVANRTELERLIADLIAAQPLKHWLAVFDGSGMPYAPINDVRDTLDNPHSRARNMVQTVQHPSCGPVELVGPPVKFSAAQPSIRSAPPTLGQHTDEVLAGLLGMGGEEIAELRRSGVVA